MILYKGHPYGERAATQKLAAIHGNQMLHSGNFLGRGGGAPPANPCFHVFPVSEPLMLQFPNQPLTMSIFFLSALKAGPSMMAQQEGPSLATVPLPEKPRPASSALPPAGSSEERRAAASLSTQVQGLGVQVVAIRALSGFCGAGLRSIRLEQLFCSTVRRGPGTYKKPAKIYPLLHLEAQASGRPSILAFRQTVNCCKLLQFNNH